MGEDMLFRSRALPQSQRVVVAVALMCKNVHRFHVQSVCVLFSISLIHIQSFFLFSFSIATVCTRVTIWKTNPALDAINRSVGSSHES
jgi:hypothetical protein